MSSLDYQYYPGRIKIDGVFISNSKDKVDVTDLFVEFSLNTSITNSSAVAEILLMDAVNLLAKYQINGGDDIYIEISYLDQTKKYPLKIVSINRIAHNDRQRAYVLRCISSFGYFGYYKSVQGKLEGSPSEMAKSLFLENTKEEIGLWEESLGNQRIVVPNWSLGYTLEWLAQRAVWKDDSVRFRFFQDSNMRYNFMPIEKALQLYKQKPVMKYSHNLIANSIGPNQIPNSEAVNRAIKNIDYEDSFNITNAIQTGKLSSIKYSPNIVEKKYSVLGFDYFNNFSKEKYLNSFPQFRKEDFEGAAEQYTVNTSFTQQGKDVLNKVSDISSIRQSTLDESQTINIEVVGNQVVDIGQVVDIEIASPEPVSDNRDNDLDTRWSGLYYVVAKRDVFTRDEHKMVLAISKESQIVGDSLG